MLVFKLIILIFSIFDFSIGLAIHNKACSLSGNLKNEIRSYQNTVNEIIKTIVHGKFAGDTFRSLEKFTDKFGHRLAGSSSLEKGIDYMIDEFKNAGLENVHTENAEVPHWVRGYEKAEILTPIKTTIPILGLGSSIGTPKGGITADVIVVKSFEELNKLPNDKVDGKIVVFAPEWVSYGVTVEYRKKGASEASKKGAVASLIRSAAPFSIGSPHTGSQTYSKTVKPIPTACITIEDSERLLRIYSSGDKIRIKLEMDDVNLSPIISRNTIGEIIGTLHKNDSIVLLSGHIDSWDVGVGAMDDGGGAFISWKALEYLKALDLIPKRTLRALLWTGEEVGLKGAEAYQKGHEDKEKEEFNFLMESDSGVFNPLGLDFSGNSYASCIFQEIIKLMTNLNATKYSANGGGPDIGLWTSRGFPGGGLLDGNEKYFWFHHTAGDSMTIINSTSLDRGTALFAAASYVIADLSINMPRDLK